MGALNLYLDGDTAIAEWEAELDDRVEHIRKVMREVALLVIDGHLIKACASTGPQRLFS